MEGKIFYLILHELHLLIYIFKIFPGKIKFCFDGRFHTARDWIAVPGVLSLILIPAGFHFGFEYIDFFQ